MRHSILPDLIRPQLDFSALPELVHKYWFRLILIGLGVYVLLVKDVNFQFSLNSAPVTPATEIPDNFWEEEVATPVKNSKNPGTEAAAMEMSMMSGLGTTVMPSAKPAIAKAAPVSTPKVKKNLANNFSNLTFIMSPTYASRHNIPEEVVREKKRKCNFYVQRFAPVAISEMKKFGIPASITLAQALLESNVGESRLTKANKNHFGIKCFSQKCKKGHCANFTDDTHKDFFRVYQSAWESYRAHSGFLQGKRYQHLKNLGPKDYKGWANGLSKAGYATDKKYAEKLIKIIETLGLDKYDA